jgi:hypothetical protein
MSNALSRVERYSNLAEECRRLAAATFSIQLRNRYSHMAEIYTALAEAEEIRRTSLLRMRGARRNAMARHEALPNGVAIGLGS